MKTPIEELYPWGRNQLMAVCAVQYCLGRMTYIVSDCVDWLIANWDKFDYHTKALIKRDVEHAFTRDDAWRAHSKNKLYDYLGVEDYRALGMDCDRALWERARKLWEDGGE